MKILNEKNCGKQSLFNVLTAVCVQKRDNAFCFHAEFEGQMQELCCDDVYLNSNV
jgi:hypothetical protein